MRRWDWEAIFDWLVLVPLACVGGWWAIIVAVRWVLGL